MTAELNSIKTAYEEEGLSPEFIAEDRNLELPTVKAALMQCSSRYRKECGQEEPDEDGLNFSKDEARRVKDMMLDLALSAEDEHLRAKMCTIVYDDHKGRRDLAKGMNGANFNVLMINKLIQSGRGLADNLKQKVVGNGREQKVINV